MCHLLWLFIPTKSNPIIFQVLPKQSYEEDEEESVNAPWFDRWLPRTAAIRELGERGMMSLLGWERLRRTMKAQRCLEMVT